MAGSDLLINNPRPSFEIDGEEKSHLAADLISLEVIEDELGLPRMEAVFLNWGRSDRSAEPGFVYFDGDIIDLGRNIVVHAGADDDRHEIFNGVVTSVEGVFSSLRPPEICVRGESATQWMRMRRRTRFYEDQTDGDIAQQVADDHGLRADVSENGTTHAELWQVNQSDLDFLRDRARATDARLGFEDGRLVFAPRRGDAEDPIVLSRENELLRFSVNADLAHQRTEVRVHGYDVAAKSAIHESAGSDAVTAETGNTGRTGPEVLSDLSADLVDDLHLEAPATTEEAQHLAESMMRRRARRFVCGRGTTSGTPALHVGAKVDLVDLGAWFAGVYHIAEVRHTFDQATGLRTHFRAERVTLGGRS